MPPFLTRLQTLGPQARLYSYLGDTYLVVEPSLAALALAGLADALRPLGLELNHDKTCVWSQLDVQRVFKNCKTTG